MCIVCSAGFCIFILRAVYRRRKDSYFVILKYTLYILCVKQKWGKILNEKDNFETKCMKFYSVPWLSSSRKAWTFDPYIKISMFPVFGRLGVKLVSVEWKGISALFIVFKKKEK